MTETKLSMLAGHAAIGVLTEAEARIYAENFAMALGLSGSEALWFIASFMDVFNGHIKSF